MLLSQVTPYQLDDLAREIYEISDQYPATNETLQLCRLQAAVLEAVGDVEDTEFQRALKDRDFPPTLADHYSFIRMYNYKVGFYADGYGRDFTVRTVFDPWQ